MLGQPTATSDIAC